MSELTDRLHQILNQPVKPFIKDDDHWFSTDQLRTDIAVIQHHLIQAGLQPGDRVLLGLPNSYRLVVIYLAVIEYGATIVSMDPNMPKSEFNSYMGRSCPVMAFIDKEHADFLLDEIPQDGTITSIFVPSSQPCGLEWYRLQQSVWSPQPLKGEKFIFQPHSPEETSIAIILYTSGTTGKPKAVGLTHQQVLATAQNVILSHKLTSSDIAYSILPLFHINAQVVSLLSTCVSNGKLVLEPKFSASKFWKTVREEKITWISAVPTIIAIILKIEKPKQIPKSLRFVRSASSKLQVGDAKLFEQKFQIPLIESYGMTEAASQICVNPLPPQKRKLGSVGLPVGLELQIVNDNNSLQKPNEIGEIVLRGKNVITKYLQAENQNDFSGGWFHTGDVGYVDEEGYVYIVGRKKELIIHGGENISPYEVEDVISQLDTVDQVAVIGLPDPLYGEQVSAFVVANEQQLQKSESIESLKKMVVDQCKSSLSGFKCPQVVYVVEKLPFGPTGKIQRNILKQTYKEFILN